MNNKHNKKRMTVLLQLCSFQTFYYQQVPNFSISTLLLPGTKFNVTKFELQCNDCTFDTVGDFAHFLIIYKHFFNR